MHRNDPDGLGYRFLRQNAAASQCSPHPRGAAAGRGARMRLLSVLPAPARGRLRESTNRSTAGCATPPPEVPAEKGESEERRKQEHKSPIVPFITTPAGPQSQPVQAVMIQHKPRDLQCSDVTTPP